MTYNVGEEVEKVKGNIDFIYYPKNINKAVIILELKVDSSTENAIKQIHERKYYHNLNEKYKGNVILLEINLNKDKKSIFLYNRRI